MATMRLLISTLMLTLAVAVTASVFAIWPVVADAPWEEKEAPKVEERGDEIRCEGALRLREAATAALGNLQPELYQCRYCPDPGPATRISRTQLAAVQDQLEEAEREISRYC